MKKRSIKKRNEEMRETEKKTKAKRKNREKSKKMSKRKSKKQKTAALEDFEEITYTCPNCGKQIKMIKLKGLKTEGLLCQRCAQGEIDTDTG